MTDYTELKKLAEAAPEGPWFGPDYAPGTGYVFDNCLGSLLHYESIEYEQESCLSFVAAANPAAVLKLIAENEKLRAKQAEANMLVGDSAQYALKCQSERDQLKAEVDRFREFGCTSCDGSGWFHGLDGEFRGPCDSCGAYELAQVKREREQFRKAAQYAVDMFEKITSADGSGHADLARAVRRIAGPYLGGDK